MSLRESVTIALEALWANKLRSTLTMLGIIIGVAAVIAVVAIGRGGQALVLQEFDTVGSALVWIEPNWMAAEGSFKRIQYLNFDDLAAVQELPGVAAASPESRVGVTAKHGRESRTTTAYAVGPDYANIRNLKLSRGRFISDADVERAQRVAVIGEEMEEKLFGAGKGLGEVVRIDDAPHTVVGVLQKPEGFFANQGFNGSMQLFVPYTTLRRLTGEEDLLVVFMRPESPDRAPQVQRAAQALMDERYKPATFTVNNLEQVTGSFRKVTDVLTSVIGGIAGIALLVGGIGIMNIMLVSVTERTREIGIRKALGARRGDILRQFLIEAVVLSVTGGMVGMAMGGALALVAGKLLKLPSLVSWQTALLAITVSVVVGVLFGVYPANRAARLDPIEALRYE